MRIRIQMNCWKAVGVVSVAATVTVVAAENLRVPPPPPLPPTAEKVAITMPPMPPSPVENFRYWLNLTPEQRKRLLATLPEADRKALLEKLAFYDSLPADARDLRLSETQLHWQVLSLMKMPAAERKQRVAQLPADNRAVVEERLQQWDAWPVNKQKTFLENEHVVGLYLQLQETAPQERGKVLANLPSDVRFPLEQRLQKWNNMPPTQRQELSDRFTVLFQSEENAQKKIVKGLPEDVRKPVEKLMEQLEQMPSEQRQRCTAALNKFLKMSADDQRQFLQNATRWQTMTEKEHKAWRQVVNKVPQMPPIPPGMPAPAPLIAGTNSVVPVNAP